MDDRIVHHLYLHAIFSTKNQDPVLDEDVREHLAHYIGGTIQDMKCVAMQMYIGSDHIHILYKQSDEISVDAGINTVRRESEAWLRTRNNALKNFQWQKAMERSLSAAWTLVMCHSTCVINRTATASIPSKTSS